MVGLKICLFSFLLQAVLTERTDITVQCEAGTFIGFQEDVQLDSGNITMTKFLGVPYAEPPVGNLRFRKPIAKQPLTEPYKAQTFGPACQQLSGIFPPMDRIHHSEDCLYLNILKPEVTKGEDKLPVMVWIYGGAFVLGDSAIYNGEALAANGPVIVVTLNYRLTAWGFLSTGDSNAPGNYGLWDQHFAIRWVHKNIEAFGGDPNRITIFGESAGGASVIFQGLYPGNAGLFQRIIAQSGTAAAQWALTSDNVRQANHIASLVGCDNGNNTKLVECLRETSVEKLNASINDLRNWNLTVPFPFIPVVDGDFVHLRPMDSLDHTNAQSAHARKHFASYDLMIGLNSGEGTTGVTSLFGFSLSPENFLPNKTFFDEVVVPSLIKKVYGENTPDVIRDLVISEYTDWENPENPSNIRHKVCDMFGDALFLQDPYRTVRAHVDLSNKQSFMYYFNILPYKSLSPRPSWSFKPRHADDLKFVFGNKLELNMPGVMEYHDLHDWEKRASDNIMTLWTNFAKTGNPNKPRDIGVDWLPYTRSRHRYLELSNDVTASRLKERLFERRARLWSDILPAIVRASKCEEKASGTCSKDSCSP